MATGFCSPNFAEEDEDGECESVAGSSRTTISESGGQIKENTSILDNEVDELLELGKESKGFPHIQTKSIEKTLIPLVQQVSYS